MSTSASLTNSTTTTLEEMVQTQAREIQRYRQDYQDLSHKFNHINNQIKERDLVHLDRLKTAENHIQHLEKENSQYRSQLSVFKADRKAQHKKDKNIRKELDAAVSVMEEREEQIERQLAENNSKMRRMEADLLVVRDQLDIYKKQNEQLSEDKSNLSRVIKDEMVPRADYQASINKFEKFQEVVSSETISLDEYEIVCKKLANLKKVLETNYVSADEYEDLSHKYCRLEQRLQEMVSMDEFTAVEAKADSAWKQVEKMIPRTTYAKLQNEANAVLERQMLLEASAQVLRDDKDEAVRQRTAMRLEADEALARLAVAERELKEVTSEFNDLKESVADRDNTIQHLENELAAKSAEFIASQDKTASLSVALGNNKSMLHREMSSRTELLNRLEQCQNLVTQLQDEKRELEVRHQGEMGTLRKVHQRQVLQYETKCAELISGVDMLKYQIGKSRSGGDKQIANGTLTQSDSATGDFYKSRHTQSISSPYKALMSQHLQKQSGPSTPQQNGVGSRYTESKSPDIYPHSGMQLSELRNSSPTKSYPLSPYASLRPDSGSKGIGARRTGGAGGEESTLESLCASFKSHMSESSKLFTNEIQQVDF